MVAFDTTSHRSNLELVAWVTAMLSDLGATTSILPSADGKKANLFATLGPVRDGGLVLSGHTDVVPADATDWASPPFQLSRRGDRLHGRGACDMKGSIACALAFAKRFDPKASPIPIHFALSYDEELGCLGVPGIVSEFGRSLPKPGLVMVIEPTGMRPIVAHKGYRAFETQFLGVPAHSSRPDDGISAIRIATAFISALEELGDELFQGINVADMAPSFSTINVGHIAGGLATNMVPPQCRILWELRPVPGVEVQAVLDRLGVLVAQSVAKVIPVADIGSRIVTRETGAEPTFSDPSGAAFRLVQELTGIERGETAAYGSEAGFFHAAGIPTVIIGPGDVLQAHKIDEYIEVDQLAAGLGFLDTLELRLRRNGVNGL